MPASLDAPTVKAVVFDMDGVLIDSASVIENAWKEAARRHGQLLTPEDVHRYVHGRPGYQTVRSLFPDYSSEQQQEICRCVDGIEELSACEPIPGVLSIIHQLHGAGVPLALVTSSWPARIAHVLGQLGLGRILTTVINREEVPRGKPHPDPYLMAAVRLDKPPADILVFEDSDSGIASAIGAGASCIAVGRHEVDRPGVVASIPDFTGLTLARRDPDRLVLAGAAVHVVIHPAGSAPITADPGRTPAAGNGQERP
jgi:HAD superfamily hydrolase (TIGR01509 family)